MIRESKPVTMAEVSEMIVNSEKAENVKLFIKNFDVLDAKDARELFEKINNLNMIKLKDEHIVKMVDFLPTDATELSKTVSGLSLDQDEITKILELIKEYRQ